MRDTKDLHVEKRPNGAIALKPELARKMRIENQQEYSKLREKSKHARADIIISPE